LRKNNPPKTPLLVDDDDDASEQPTEIVPRSSLKDRKRETPEKTPPPEGKKHG
jgi:hypothetical protein